MATLDKHVTTKYIVRSSLEIIAVELLKTPILGSQRRSADLSASSFYFFPDLEQHRPS